MRRSAEPLITGGSGSFNDGSSSSSSGDEFERGQSRYASDFKERRILGRGGCGEVCEVLNRLDRRTYAIKKVRLTGGASRRGVVRMPPRREIHDISSTGRIRKARGPCRDRDRKPRLTHEQGLDQGGLLTLIHI